MQQQVAPAGLEQRLDLGHGIGLRRRQLVRRRRALRGHGRHDQARLELDEAIPRKPAHGRGGRAAALDQLGQRERAVDQQLEQRTALGGRPRHAGGRDPDRARWPHARRERQRERARGGRAVVGRDPEAQLEHRRSDARLVGQPLDEGELPLVVRRPARLDHDAAHGAPGQRHVHDVAGREIELIGLQVVERLPQGAGGHQGNDADRAGHRGIMAHRVGAPLARV